MSKNYLLGLLTAVCFSAPVFASEHEYGDVATAQTIIKEIQAIDRAYIAAHKASFFKELSKGQHPRATVVTCSDSRVHTNLLDKTPEGDLFMIRNIGNQLATSKGSVQYGVNHLASSLLIFIGHSSCGAIKAASSDYADIEPDIKKELDTINITKGAVSIDGVKTNVNNQVAAALKEFDEKVKAGQLLVVGAVYDFADDMKQGAGKLNIINVNGDTDGGKIKTALSAKAAAAGHGEHGHH
jgi:carbonic anhydrase